VAYVGFLVVVLWSVAFLADVDRVPSVDGSGPSRLIALGVDLALLGLFALHHSVMARSGAKRWVTRVVPASLERTSYVLVADLLLALVLWLWQPISGSVWEVHDTVGRGVIWAVFGLGWGVAVASTFMIDHFDLVGIRQALRPASAPPVFQVRWLYRWVRHPLMLGLLIAFWATPSMSVGHLLFALASTAYVAVGVHFEERDLVRDLGEPYEEYARRVPPVVPRLRARPSR
jgi:protein-S-isoprenylcysteine O-methyltransferase Ste14